MILIKEEMPKCCAVCWECGRAPYINFMGEPCYYCRITKNIFQCDFDVYKNRHESCPMQEMTTEFEEKVSAIPAAPAI